MAGTAFAGPDSNASNNGGYGEGADDGDGKGLPDARARTCS